MNYHYDWLTITRPGSHREAQLLAEFGYEPIGKNVIGELQITDIWLPQQPERFYPHVIAGRETGIRISISDNLTRQGIRVIMPGKAAQQVFEAWNNSQALRQLGWKATRLDMAFDVTGKLDIFRYYSVARERWQSGHPVSAKLDERPGGEMLTVGARTSDQYLRIYNKAKEQRVEGDWWRAELEMKGKVAKAVWDNAPQPPYAPLKRLASILTHPEPTVLDEIVDFIESGVGGYEFPKEQRDKSDAWWREQITAAYKNLTKRNPALALEMNRRLRDIAMSQLGRYE